MDLIERARKHGIVGAGGAGFPTYIKLKARADTLLINAAECEPLLHKDKEILRAFTAEIIAGIQLVQQAIGATRSIIGIKAKYKEVIAAIDNCGSCQTLIFHRLADFYPAGDEFVLVYESTGRVIPAGKLPLHVGVVVMNVETVLNIVREQPVIRKFLTIAGAVKRPITISAPIGMSIRDAIAVAGGASEDPYAVLSGGVMMGSLVQDLDLPITRTTGGILVFPEQHQVIRRYRRDWRTISRIGRSACDQCSFCTDLCPRYLLGHPITPHNSMKTLLFSGKPDYLAQALYCCECNLCSMFSCPEDLDPKEVCVELKRKAREAKVEWRGQPRPEHPLINDRHIPLRRLFLKLGLTQFSNTGPLSDCPTPQLVRIPTRQHVGQPAVPIVQAGNKVRAGDVIADVELNALGVPIHASITGRVAFVSPELIEIVRED